MVAKDLTAGSIPLLVIRLGLPAFAGYALHSLYHLADIYFVGRLGSASIAGLSLAANTFFVVLAVGMTIGVGALALMSHAYGRGARGDIPVLLQQALWMGLAAGGLMWLAGSLGAAAYMSVFTDDPAVLAEGTAYFRIFSATFVTGLFAIVMLMCFRAVGDFITPTALTALGVVLNVALDPVMIFGLGPLPGLGVRGAALATIISQTIVVAVLGYLLVRRPRAAAPGPLHLRRPFGVHWRQMGRMLRIGVPAGAQFLLFAFTMFVTYRMVRPFGAEATAATGVGFRLLETCVLPLVSVGAAVASLAGQNLGARRLERVRAAAVWGIVFGTGIAVAEYAALVAAPRFWIGLFSDDTAVQAIGAEYLVIGGLGVMLMGPGQTIIAVGQGLGRTGLPLVANAFRLGSFLALLVVVVGLWGGGITGVFWSRALSQVPELMVLAGVLAWWWRTLLRPRPAAAPLPHPNEGPEPARAPADA